ncbi:unnamed protein product [Effrenium voratum]|uniref:Uncharacterized protein n=1 Tax=Effrenium voratum TaxID=2562239 RepID=A0AA36IZU2_9DINO|nr:unnamed protein product [Effrenium voratum]
MGVGSLTSAAFLLLWVIAATVVAAVFTVRYVGIVEEDQAWYLQGSARAAAAEAQAVLGAVLEAKQALIASIEYGLVRTDVGHRQ